MFLKAKPCPFCGAKRGLYALDVDQSSSGEPCVFCDNCKATFECENACTLEETVEAWNTRHERTCHYVEVTPGGIFGWCGECGTMLHFQDNYCPKCGNKVVS